MSELGKLLDAWDRMERAAQRVETALPRQMSDAIAKLETARLNMRTVVQEYSLQLRKEASHG